MAQLKDLIVNGPSRFIGDVYATTFTGNLEGNANTATNATNAGMIAGLSVHSGRNNEANKIVRTDGNGYLQVGYINSSSGHEKNASNPTYVWGSNSSDSYLRSYQTSSLSVSYATTSGSCSGNAASSIQSLLLSSTSDAKGALGVYFHRDLSATSNVGNTEGNGVWGHPSDSQDARYGNASILRIGWDSKYYTDIFTGPNIASGKYGLQWRQIVNGTANDWKMLLDSSNYNYYALPLSGGTMSNTNVVTNLNADLLDGLHASSFSLAEHTHSQYLTSALIPAKLARKETYPPGYFIIKINNNNSEWMLSFDVKIVVTDGSYTIRFSEDNRSMSKSWSSPSASMIDGEDSVEVKFGYSQTNKWVAILIPESYVGISITNVANGYAPIDTYALNKLFSIDFYMDDVLQYLGTVQKTITIYPPSKEGHTHTFASLTSKPTTISGYGITDALTNKYIIYKKDFQYYVILLCKIGTNTTNTQHTINGTFWALSGGAIRYQAAYINAHCADWSTNHNEYYGFTPFGLGTKCRLVTCTYQSGQYLAITFENVQGTYIYFDGSYSNILFTPILYYTSNTSTVENSEIYNSISEVTYNKIPLISSAETALTSSNYNSYAPKLDGTGASGTWGININGYAGALCKYINITDLNVPSWGLTDGFSINYNTCTNTVSNAPSSINNANLIMNIQNGKHGSSGQYGWQVGFFNQLNSPYVRKWSAGSVGAWYKLLHSGNYNEFTPSLTGSGASGTWGISISGNAATVGGLTVSLISSDIKTGYWGSLGYGSTKKLTLGSNYGGVVWNAENYCASLMFGSPIDTHGFISIGYNSPIVSFAGSNNSNANNDNPNWYFKLKGTTGTTYDLNCAPTATKLATSRTIWGQSFDGTGNVNGFPSFPACININRNAQTGAILDPSKIGFEIETYANDARLKTYTASGGSNPTHLVLTSSGNVGIGTISPSYKLHVVGTAYASGGLVSDGPVKVNESFVVDGTNGSWYGKLNIADEVYILGEDTNINFIESLNIKQHNTTNNTETSIVSIDNSGNITLNVMNNNGGSYEISTRSGALGIGIPSDDPNIVRTPSFLMSNRGYIYINASLPSSPNYPLVVNGTIQCTTLSQTSDIKYKSNIKQIKYEEALKIIENLNPVTWDWNENTVETGSSSGFVAQEAEEFIPNAISRDNENNLSLDYTQLHSYEIRVIQEQQKEIIKLKEKLKILENLIS